MDSFIEDGDVEGLTKYLNEGGDPNKKIPSNGFTPLAYAILQEASDEIVTLLISKGADPNMPFLPPEGFIDEVTLLQYAVETKDLGTAALLLDNGADPNKVGSDAFEAPLITACQLGDHEMVELLLDKGANPNIESPSGRVTPVFIAASRDNEIITKLLLDKGADPNRRNGISSQTPLLVVTGNSSKSHILTKLLLEKGADPNLASLDTGVAPIHSAISRKNLETVKLLLENGANPNLILTATGSTPLLHAISIRGIPISIIQLLVEKGADPNKANEKIEDTPLINAVHSELFDIVKLLLEKGADPNKDNPKTGTLPIVVAATRTDIRLLTILIEKGADVNRENLKKGSTALIAATRFKNIEFIRLLLEKGADPNKTNKDGEKAIDFTTEHDTEIRELLSGKKPEPPAPYSGKSKSDIEFFDLFLGKVDEKTTEDEMKNMIRNTTFCPVCLSNTIRIDGCLYMHHVCDKSARNETLYNKYKNETGEIWWCVDCCRICSGHRHYKIGIASEEKPALQPAGAAFAKACDGSDGSASNGGGSTTEKLKRIARMIDYAFELQHFVGEITEKDAKDELIEEVWNSAIMRLRFDPLKFKRWKTDLSVFKETASTVSVVPEAIPESGDIDTPKVDTGSDFISLEDGIPVIQFKHKNKDGVMFNHIHGDDDMRFIGKASLITFMKTMGEKLGKCFDDDCGGWLWPQEIEMALNDPKLKDSVTDEDRAVLKSYKERFNAAKAPKTGGARWKFNFFSEMEDGQCYLPKRKAGNRTRKNKKRAKKTRSNK